MINLQKAQERLQKAQEGLEKLQKTLERHTAAADKLSKLKHVMNESGLIAKKYDWAGSIEKANYWIDSDIESKQDDIRSTERKIADKQAYIEKCQANVVAAQAELEILKEIPGVLTEAMQNLEQEWNNWDFYKRECIREAERTLSYDELRREYTYREREWARSTDEQIKSANKRDAQAYMLDLVYRVNERVGKIVNVEYLHLGACGVCLNGRVDGEKGTVYIDTIYAGGYNIQRLHVRTLLK